MKILLTGYKGFIGSNLNKFLTKRGHDVIGYHWGDNLDLNVDFVIHLGAVSSTHELDFNKIKSKNIDFTIDLLDTCNAKGIPIQYASSASVYGNTNSFKEDSCLNPLSYYSLSKMIVDQYVMQTKWKTTVQGFRYFNVFGPGEETRKQTSAYISFKKQFDETGKVFIYKGSEKYSRDYVSVDYVMQVHEQFFNVTESGIWNVGSGNTVSILDIAKSITDNIEYIDMPEETTRKYQIYTCSDNDKMLNTIRKYKLDLVINHENQFG